MTEVVRDFCNPFDLLFKLAAQKIFDHFSFFLPWAVSLPNRTHPVLMHGLPPKQCILRWLQPDDSQIKSLKAFVIAVTRRNPLQRNQALCYNIKEITTCISNLVRHTRFSISNFFSVAKPQQFEGTK